MWKTKRVSEFGVGWLAWLFSSFCLYFICFIGCLLVSLSNCFELLVVSFKTVLFPLSGLVIVTSA